MKIEIDYPTREIQEDMSIEFDRFRSSTGQDHWSVHMADEKTAWCCR